MNALKLIFRSVNDFFKDGGVMLSAYLSYSSMMAVVPFCLLLVTAFGYLLGGNEAFYSYLAEKLVGFFPSITKDITEELRKIIVFRGIGRLSILIYGLLSYQFFISLQTAVNAVFKTKKRNTLLRSMFFSLVIITLIITILFLSFALTLLIPVIHTLKVFLPWLETGSLAGYLIKFIVPFMLMLCLAVAVYVILPMQKVALRHALIGGLFTASMLELAKHIFTWYVGSIAGLGTIYGSLTAFVVFLLWVFYASCLFIIGAEIVKNKGEKK